MMAVLTLHHAKYRPLEAAVANKIAQMIRLGNRQVMLDWLKKWTTVIQREDGSLSALCVTNPSLVIGLPVAVDRQMWATWAVTCGYILYGPTWAKQLPHLMDAVKESCRDIPLKKKVK